MSSDQVQTPSAPTFDRSMSLTLSLQAVLSQAGCVVDLDELHAVLGLSLLVCAAPIEYSSASWPTLARDAFLAETAKLYGVMIRDLHPPTSARGLHDAVEFPQHFDASYRPLILRALEHRQPILAWRGWSDEFEGLWGIVTGASDAGVGLEGVPLPEFARPRTSDAASSALSSDFSSNDSSAPSTSQMHPIPLTRPPVQVYVVESIQPVRPNQDEFWDVVLDYARRAYTIELAESFGVVTGSRAYDAWAACLSQEPASDEARREIARGHVGMTQSILAGHRSAIRLFERNLDRVDEPLEKLLGGLLSCCGRLTNVLAPSPNIETVVSIFADAKERAKMISSLASARTIAEEVQRLLDA